MKSSLEWVTELFSKHVGEYVSIVEKKCWYDVTLLNGEHVCVTLVTNDECSLLTAYSYITALSGSILHECRGKGIKRVYGFAINKSRTEYVAEYGMKELTKINLLELYGADPIHVFMIGSREV